MVREFLHRDLLRSVPDMGINVYQSVVEVFGSFHSVYLSRPVCYDRTDNYSLELVLCGHSLGAGVAAMLGMVSCFAFSGRLR